MTKYEPFGLSNDSSTLIRLMQRNYGLEQTGKSICKMDESIKGVKRNILLEQLTGSSKLL